MFMSANTDSVVDDLLAALPPGKKAPWRGKLEKTAKASDPDRVTMEKVATLLRASFSDPDKVTLASLSRGWPCDLWPFRDPLAYMGKDGGGGIGSGMGGKLSGMFAGLGAADFDRPGEDVRAGAAILHLAVDVALVLRDGARRHDAGLVDDGRHHRGRAQEKGRDGRKGRPHCRHACSSGTQP